MPGQKIIEHIVSWLKDYSEHSHTAGFVVGVSGGIDSAVTSALCALSGKRTLVLNLPIRQFQNEYNRSAEQIAWLKKKFTNIETHTLDLSSVLDQVENTFPKDIQDFMVMANTRSRLRMMCLYAFAGRHGLIVAGTGNKVEDFGLGFFTKYGDGGVDLSPIADLSKTEVYALGRFLGVPLSIQEAAPTDGLFADGRTDEDQIGASYPELEWAMEYKEKGKIQTLNSRQKHVLEIYETRNRANLHKMQPIPVCVIPKNLRS